MPYDIFEQQIEAAQERLDALRQRAATLHSPQTSLVAEALEELSTTLEELYVAMEEMVEQNQELEAIQETLEIERRRYQELFEFAPDAYLTTDPQGLIREANQAALTLCNRSAELLIGKPLLAWVAPTDHALFHRMLTRLQKGTWTSSSFELAIVSRAGHVPVALTVTAILDRDGRLVGLRWLLHDISERKRMEEALRESEARLRSIVDTAVDAIIVNNDQGTIESVNPATEKLFGHATTELIGRNINLLMPDAYQRDEADPYLAQYRTTPAGGVLGSGRELMARRRDGTLFPIEITLSEMWLGKEQKFTGIIRDITERKQAEQALRTNEAELRLITAQIPSIVWITDSNLRVRQVFGAGRGLLDYNPDAFVGRTLYEAFTDQLQEFFPIEAHQRALTGEAINYQCRHKDTYYDIRVEPLRGAGGAIDGCIGLAMDVSESKHAEAKLRQLQTELAYAGRLSTVGGMAAGLAHELNQPLTAIVTYAQACLKLLHTHPDESDKLTDALEHMAAQGQRAAEVIRRMRDFTRGRSARQERVDLNALVRQVVSFVDWQARRHGVEIRLDLDPAIAPALADAIQIQQVLLNLLNNAIEAFGDEAPMDRRVVIRTAAATADSVEVMVGDNGPGISAEAMRHLFEPFFTTKPEGTGVGLSISRSIVESHKGRLWATANPTGGATFHFTLPPAGAMA